MPTRTVVAVLAALALAACSSSSPKTEAPTAKAAKVVNVYSGRHYDADAEIYKRFEQETGIQVRTLEAPGPELLERLKAEGDYAQADLVVTSDGGNLEQLQEAGLLQAIDAPNLTAAVPERLRDPGGRWFAISKRARVIVFAKDNPAAAAIKTYAELTDPRFRGQICVRSSTNTYNLSLLAERIARDGAAAAQAWAAGVKANFAREPEGSDTDQIKAVAAGACSLALVNHYYLVRMAASPDPEERAAAAKVGLVFPDAEGRGAHINVSGAGVAAHAPHRDNAIALLRYLESPEAQRLISDLNQEYPVNPEAPPSTALQALGPFKESDVPLAALGQNQAEAQRIYDAVGWR